MYCQNLPTTKRLSMKEKLQAVEPTTMCERFGKTFGLNLRKFRPQYWAQCGLKLEDSSTAKRSVDKNVKSSALSSYIAQVLEITHKELKEQYPRCKKNLGELHEWFLSKTVGFVREDGVGVTRAPFFAKRISRGRKVTAPYKTKTAEEKKLQPKKAPKPKRDIYGDATSKKSKSTKTTTVVEKVEIALPTFFNQPVTETVAVVEEKTVAVVEEKIVAVVEEKIVAPVEEEFEDFCFDAPKFTICNYSITDTSSYANVRFAMPEKFKAWTALKFVTFADTEIAERESAKIVTVAKPASEPICGEITRTITPEPFFAKIVKNDRMQKIIVRIAEILSARKSQKIVEPIHTEIVEPTSEPKSDEAKIIDDVLAQFPKKKFATRTVETSRPLSTKNLLAPDQSTVSIMETIAEHKVSDEALEFLEKKICELRVAEDFKIVAAEILNIPFVRESTLVYGYMGIESKYCYEIPTNNFTRRTEEKSISEFGGMTQTIEYFDFKLAVGAKEFYASTTAMPQGKYIGAENMVVSKFAGHDNLELFLQHKLILGELTGVEHLETFLTAAKLRNNGDERKLLKKALNRRIWETKVDNTLEEIFRPGAMKISPIAIELQEGKDLAATDETKHPLTSSDEYSEFTRYAEITNFREAVAYMQIEKNGKPVIRYRQYRNKSSKNIAELLRANVAKNMGTYCELIEDDCRFFCDIDDQKNTIKNFREVIEEFAASFEMCFKQYMGFGAEEEIDVRKRVMFPSPWKYNSAHIVFIIERDGNELVAENAKAQRDFWYRYSKCFFGEHSHILDLSVYRPRTTLRMAYSYKNGQALVPDNIDEDDEIENILVNPPTYATAEPVVFCRYSRQYFWSEHEQNILLAHINRSNTWIGPQSAKLGQSIRYDNYRRFLEIIVSAFWNRGVQYCCKLASEISPDERLEKIIAELFLDRPHVSLDQALKFFPGQLMFTETKSITTGINYKEIFANIKSDNPRAVIVKSGCNTRKTFNFMAANKKRVLYIVHRVTLANDYFETFKSLGIEACHYDDYEEMADAWDRGVTETGGKKVAENIPSEVKKLYVPINLVCVINSIHKFAPILKYYDEVFIDECCAVFKQISFVAQSLADKKLVYTAFEKTFEEIITKKNVTVVSANVGAETFNVFEYYGRKIDYALHNVFLDKSKYNYIAYHTSGLWLAKVHEFLAEGKKICIPCNNITHGAKLAEEIRMKYGDAKSVLIISKDFKGDEANTAHWKNYDIVIYSPTIDSGVSFVPEYFDYICAYFQSNINTSDACFQALWRVRNPINKTIHVYIQRTYAPAFDTFFDGKELLFARAKGFTLNKEARKNYRSKLSEMVMESVFGADNFRASLRPMEKIILDNDAYVNYDRDNFSQSIIDYLKESGMEGIIIFYQESTKTVRTIVNGNYTEGNTIAKKIGITERKPLPKNAGANKHTFKKIFQDEASILAGRTFDKISYPSVKKMLDNIVVSGAEVDVKKLFQNKERIMEEMKSLPREAEKLAMITRVNFCESGEYIEARKLSKLAEKLEPAEIEKLPEKDKNLIKRAVRIGKVTKGEREIAKLLKHCEGKNFETVCDYIVKNYESFSRNVPASKNNIPAAHHWQQLAPHRKRQSIEPRLRSYGIKFITNAATDEEELVFNRATEIDWLVAAIKADPVVEKKDDAIETN